MQDNAKIIILVTVMTVATGMFISLFVMESNVEIVSDNDLHGGRSRKQTKRKLNNRKKTHRHKH